jgi:hypothetical protein
MEGDASAQRRHHPEATIPRCVMAITKCPSVAYELSAIYPRTYNPSFATGACVLAIIFACTFALIFPLIGPAVVVLLFLSLIGKVFVCSLNLKAQRLIHSSPISCWLCVRSNTFTNWGPPANLAFTKIWNNSFIPADPSRSHPS